MHTLNKNERLGNYRLRQILFTRGHHFFRYPFRVAWFLAPEDELARAFPGSVMPGNARFRYPAKILVGVSRRNQRKAVDRNRVKRLVKEAYRKNKNLFYPFLQRKQACLLLGMIYVGKSLPTYAETEAAVRAILTELVGRMEKAGKGQVDDTREINGR